MAAGKFHLGTTSAYFRGMDADRLDGGCHSRDEERANTDRLLDDHVPDAGERTGHNLSVAPNGLAGKPADVAGSIGSLAHGVVPRLAVLPDDQSSNILQVGLEEVVQFGQVRLSLGRRGVLERLERLVCDLDGFAGIFKRHLGACTDDLARCRVCKTTSATQSLAFLTSAVCIPLTVDIEGLAVRRLDMLSVDDARLDQERRVIEPELEGISSAERRRSSSLQTS